MGKIAVDIALLPPEDIMDICIDLCKKYPDNSGKPGLNKTDNLPHISLFMGMVEEKNLEELYTKIQRIINDFQQIETSLKNLTKITRPVGYSAYFFQIKNTNPLKNLHKKIVEKLPEYHPKDSNEKIFFKNEGEKIDEQTFFWVDNYITGSSIEKFWPHITLKACDDPVYDKLPKPTTLDRLAICQLGDHCTCRKILWETKLQKQSV